MMTAEEYRARAQALEASAEACANHTLTVELEACARQWRMLGEFADLQDAMALALAETRDGAGA